MSHHLTSKGRGAYRHGHVLGRDLHFHSHTLHPWAPVSRVAVPATKAPQVSISGNLSLGAAMSAQVDDTDYLGALSNTEVAAFYRRLALFIQRKIGADSLAATLLLHWLDGKGKTKVYPSKYVRELSEVRSYLRDVARPMFLSQKNVPHGGIGGIVPRLQGKIKSPPGPGYSMHLEGNVETPLSFQAEALAGASVDARELDALYGLHGFLLTSDVVVTATVAGPKTYRVKFQKWTCKATDEYHWNPTKHLLVPNPDYGSLVKGAVRPDRQLVKIYHRNAIRLEQAGLAQSFHDESEPWNEDDPTVVGEATVSI